MKMIITKEMLEDELGMKIQSFKLDPLYKKDVCIGLSVSVVPVQEVNEITITINTKDHPKYQTVAEQFKDDPRMSIDPITGDVTIK